jgi:hypothetical protein
MGCAWLGFAQTSPPLDLFTQARPQVTVTVTKHPMGADLVEITLLNPKYSAELLRGQISRLGTELNSTVRGLALTRTDYGLGNAAMALPKASFAVDGLIDNNTGEMRIAPIVRALCGAPEPYTIRDLSIIFTSQAPNQTSIQRFRSAALELQSTAYSGGFGLEYRVRLLTQDPAQIDLPEGGPEAVRPVANRPENRPPVQLLWGLVALASVATGALVYSLLLRTRSRARS